MKMPTFVVLALAIVAPATSALADASKLVCTTDDVSAVAALVMLPASEGEAIAMRVRDNYWHPQALTCSALEAGKVASTCDGEWFFGAEWATFPYAKAELIRTGAGTFAVTWTSNTFGKVLILPCAND